MRVVIPYLTNVTPSLVVSGRGRLIVQTFKEASGVNPAEYHLYDGVTTNGVMFMPVTLVANESFRDYFGEEGIPFERGLLVFNSSGQVQGSFVLDIEDGQAPAIPVVIVESAATIVDTAPVGG